MSPAKRKREAKTVVSLRVSPEVLQQVREFIVEYNTAHRAGFSYGVPEVMTEALALRWALGTGLSVLRQELKDGKKKGGPRG
jgi:hypothetical protein